MMGPTSIERSASFSFNLFRACAAVTTQGLTFHMHHIPHYDSFYRTNVIYAPYHSICIFTHVSLIFTSPFWPTNVSLWLQYIYDTHLRIH